jgi:hypothetical protein
VNAKKPQDKQYLQEMCRVLDSKLPDNYGFIVLAFPFGESPRNRMIYASNAKRQDAIAALKEWMIQCGAEEDWMKHLD